MTKTFAIAFAIASFAGLVAAVPAQAATRSVEISVNLFADRCVDHGGTIADANPSFTCETAGIAIVCDFVTLNDADCEWPGIDSQIAVNRILGMQDAQAYQGSDGGGAKKGGVKKPDLPIKW